MHSWLHVLLLAAACLCGCGTVGAVSDQEKQQFLQQYSNLPWLEEQTVTVQLGVYIEYVYLDAERGTMEVMVFQRAYWNDTRLVGAHALTQLADGSKLVMQGESTEIPIFQPPIMISGALSVNTVTEPMSNRGVKITANGAVWLSEKLRIVLACPEVASGHPWFECRIAFESYMSLADTLVLEPLPQAYQISPDISILPYQYTLDTITTNDCTVTFTVGTVSCLEGLLRFTVG